MTNSSDKTLVELEGQQHWISNDIAQNDNLLRQLFSGLSPEVAGADIERKDGRITLVPRKGTKGNSVLDILDRSPPELNPAIECCVALQHLELRVGIDKTNATAISERITIALEQSQSWNTHIKSTLQQLDQALPQPIVPLGF